MLEITEIKFNEDAPIFPSNEDNYLDDYSDSDIGACISVLGVDAILGNKIQRIGDSTKIIYITDTGLREEKGMEAFKKATEVFVKLAEEALPEMSQCYKKFYEYMINDFKQNGIEMPFYGKL